MPQLAHVVSCEW